MESHGPDAPPKCKIAGTRLSSEERSYQYVFLFQYLARIAQLTYTPKILATRMCAFRLLAELAADCTENFIELAQLLVQQHYGGESRNLWKYQPSAYEKAPCGYVGLKNLGATCYMNSLMQQFYMIPAFRW